MSLATPGWSFTGIPIPNGEEVVISTRRLEYCLRPWVSLGLLNGKQYMASPLGCVPLFPGRSFLVYINLSEKQTNKQIPSDTITDVFLEQADTSC